MTKHHTALFLGLAGIALMATPLGTWLEASLVTHTLIEYPLLVGCGVLIGHGLRTPCERWIAPFNGGGIPGLLLASFALAFWMIPRWLDASLVEPTVSLAKLITLPALVGIPLAWSWHRLHPIAEGVVKIEFLTMLLRVGWLYLAAPDRLCNGYLLDDQQWLGRWLIAIGFALAITWLIPVFFGTWTESRTPSPKH